MDVAAVPTSVRGRELAPALVRATLRFVERNLGAAAAERVARCAGLGDLEAVRADAEGTRWFSRDEVLSLARSAGALCRDDDIGRRVGEELVRTSVVDGMRAMLQASGSVEAALPGFLNAGAKMAITRRMHLVESTPGSAVIEAAFDPATDADPFFCGVVSGFYSTMPWVFGACGSIIEISCQCRGDAVCTYLLAWEGEERGGGAEVRAIVGSESVGSPDPLLRRFEQLQEMASALSAAEDISSALRLVAEMSALVVSAPRHVLAVRTSEDGELRVHQQGWDDPEEATAAARRLEHGDARPNEIVVPVASGRGHYGILSAVYSPGATVGDVERRLLTSYAKHAASAINAAAALESARRDRDAARALLALSRALAMVTTQPEVLDTLADVLPAVLASDHVWLWMWNALEARLELAATSFDLPDADLPSVLAAAEIPGLQRLALRPEPMFLDAGLERAPIERHLVATGTRWGAVVPIQARGDFLGVIVAGYRESPEAADRDDLVERMQGLAGQAGAALDNARLLDRVRDQALRDPMTGLPNRPLIEDRATHALRSAARSGTSVGLLFVDLDRFKIVNDTLGHAAGDRLICRVAARIGESLREGDTLARLGGDEFVVLLPQIDGVETATGVATRIVEGLRDPFEFDGRKLFVSCSIGVAVSGEHGSAYGDLLQHADAAMYRAKAHGRNTFEVRAKRAAPPPALGRTVLDLEADLHVAAERAELTLLYQPQIDFRTMQIVAVEALLRWDHHELGRLGPDAFLPMAEESGLIVELDRWVRETAVAQAVRWVDRATPLRVAVNISTRDLHRPTLRDEIGELLARSGLDPRLLELEITDRVVMSEERLPSLLADFRTLGVRLAIDDFGTGTSVLGRLQRCPVDVLKIDKGFVQTITAANPDAPVVAALMSLAQELGMEVVAEGVETAFQGGLLRRLGGHLGQGYFFSPPVDADAIDDLLASQVRSLVH